MPSAAFPLTTPELPAVDVVTSLADSDCTVVALLAQAGADGAETAELDGLLSAFGEGAVGIDAHLRREKARGKVGEVTAVPVPLPNGDSSSGGNGSEEEPTSLVLVAGVGDGSPASLRRGGAALARRCRGRGSVAVVADTVAGPLGAEAAGALVEGMLLGSYAVPRAASADQQPHDDHAFDDQRAPRQGRPEHHGADDHRADDHRPDDHRLRRISVVATDDDGSLQRRVVRSEVVARATWLARNLANAPAGAAGPHELMSAARSVAGEAVQVRVWDSVALEDEGFGGILAVGGGSERPPYLVQMTYEPPVAVGGPHVVLVGKGITFDSGGLSLKPRETMPLMKTDMGGAAAVLATMGALPALELPVRVTALLPLAENVPSGSAYRPGDVIRQYGGTTVEVLNTDAEGRLVLADAMAYADAVLEPDILLDIATLTGSATLALSRRQGALFTDDDLLRDELVSAGRAAGELVWPMPLTEDYRQALRSEVADLCHVTPDPSVSAGAVTAALFLQRFAGARRWAHLDIAGPARADGDDLEISKGATGFGARLLLCWLQTLAAQGR